MGRNQSCCRINGVDTERTRCPSPPQQRLDSRAAPLRFERECHRLARSGCVSRQRPNFATISTLRGLGADAFAAAHRRSIALVATGRRRLNLPTTIATATPPEIRAIKAVPGFMAQLSWHGFLSGEQVAHTDQKRDGDSTDADRLTDRQQTSNHRTRARSEAPARQQKYSD